VEEEQGGVVDKRNESFNENSRVLYERYATRGNATWKLLKIERERFFVDDRVELKLSW
jgi:hypothetical protein